MEKRCELRDESGHTVSPAFYMTEAGEQYLSEAPKAHIALIVESHRRNGWDIPDGHYHVAELELLGQ